MTAISQPNTGSLDLAIPSKSEIDQRIAEVAGLLEKGFPDQALIFGFAVLEAITRVAFGKRFSKEQTPGSVVELLAFEGYVSPSQADKIRALIKKRNRLVHGDLEVRATANDVEAFVQLIDEVWQLTLEPTSEPV